MQIKKIVGLLSLLLPIKALALEQNKASVSYDFYADNTDVAVSSPTVSVFKRIAHKLFITLKARIDAISSASIRKGGSPARKDAVTGASPRRDFEDVRYAPTLIATYNDGDNSLSVGFYYSTERDYMGRSLFANYTRQLNLQNTAVSVGISQSFDRWHPKFDRELKRSDRKERKIDLSVSQLLSPTAMVQLSYSNIYSEGFLASPYHYLLGENFVRFETLPEKRKGHAFAFRLIKLLDEPTSLNFYYRYYTDDWGINSHTFDLKVLRDISDTLTFGVRYRYYTQSSADFTKGINDYALTDRYVVVDYRYSSFSSNTLGLLLIKGFKSIKLKASINYYITSSNPYVRNWYGKDRIRAVFGSVALEYSF